MLLSEYHVGHGALLIVLNAVDSFFGFILLILLSTVIFIFAIICVLLAGKQKRTNRKVSMALFCMEVDIFREGFLLEEGFRSYSSYVYLLTPCVVPPGLELSLPLSQEECFLSWSVHKLLVPELLQTKSKDQKSHGSVEIIS